MKYINPYKLPEGIASALSRDGYSKGGSDYSITELENPPLQRWLLKTHDDEVEIDVASRLFAMLGTAVHHVIERAEHDNALSEERLSMTVEVDGKSITVSGGIDQYSEDNGGTVRDWKVTSMYVYQGKTKEDWIAQANGYAALFRANGFKVIHLEDWAILRDWSWAKWKSSPSDYPPVPFQVVKIPVWNNDKTMARIKERIALHEAASKATSQEEIEVCTEKERWTKEPHFAVWREGNKKATKVFQPIRDFGGDSPEQVAEAMVAAQDFMDEKGLDYIENRPGEDTRCIRYCPVRTFCRYGKTLEV